MSKCKLIFICVFACFFTVSIFSINGLSSDLIIYEDDLIRAIELADEYSKNKLYTEAIGILESGISVAEPFLGKDNAIIIDAKLELISLYEGEQYLSKAHELLSETIPDCINAFGENSLETAVFQVIAVNIMLRLENYSEVFAASTDVLVRATEFFSEEMLGQVLFQHAFIVACNEHMEISALFAKIWVGMDSFCINAPDLAGEYASPLDTLGIIEEFETQCKISINSHAAAELLGTPNTPEHTPYNKAQSLMQGWEIEAYAQYSALASELNRLGSNGSPPERDAARDKFREWLLALDSSF